MQTEKQTGSIKPSPPKWLHVKIYFIQKGMSEKDAEDFFLFHKKANWKTKRGRPITRWKAVANEWIWDCKQLRKQKYNSRFSFFNRNGRPRQQTYLSRFS